MTVRVSTQSRKRLDRLAKSVNRTRSFVAAEAIEQYLLHNAWQVEQIQTALAKADAGEAGVPHERVESWVSSWGSGKEMDRPKA